MNDESLPAMPFPSPSGTLLEQAGADAPSGQLRTWMHALPKKRYHTTDMPALGRPFRRRQVHR